MTNPTSFAFLYAVVATFHVGDMRHQQVWRRRYHIAAIALYLVLISGSRSSWIGLGFGVLTLAALRAVHFRALAIAAIPLVVLALSIASVFATTSDQQSKVYVLDIDLLSRSERGVEFRLHQFQRGFELWRTQPLLGIGLGSYILDHAARGFNPPQHLHNSALWLLTETGVIGALAFGTFFLVLLYGLWPSTGAPPFAITVFAILIVFVGVSIGTEALYQRHLWVLFGMAMALPPAAPDPSTSTASKPAA